MGGSAPMRQRRDLHSGLRGSDNAFGVLRLVLATSVIFSHAFYLGGWDYDPTIDWTKGQESIGGLAVIGFFVISGYLITKSGMRIDILQFMWHRSLRIFPAFWAVLIVTATVVGPVVWHHMGRPLDAYWTSGTGGPITYVTDNAMLDIRQWGIHDIFAGTTPYGPALNGSLWTLAYEWRAYLVVAVLLAAGALKRLPGAVVATAVFAYGANVVFELRPALAAQIFPWLANKQTLTLTLAFFIGATAAIFAKRIVLDGRIAIAAGLVVVATLALGAWVLLGYVAFAYVVFYLAASASAPWRRIGAKNDYSYGMYVYGFLIQQVTAYLGWYRWGYVPWVAATIAITAICAFASWHVIEKPALSLKSRGPGKGLSYWTQSLRRRSQAT